MGSKSFVAAMTAETKKRGGQRPPTADFFKLSHYNGKTKKWVAPICERIHVSIPTKVPSQHIIFVFRVIY